MLAARVQADVDPDVVDRQAVVRGGVEEDQVPGSQCIWRCRTPVSVMVTRDSVRPADVVSAGTNAPLR